MNSSNDTRQRDSIVPKKVKRCKRHGTNEPDTLCSTCLIPFTTTLASSRFGISATKLSHMDTHLISLWLSSSTRRVQALLWTSADATSAIWVWEFGGTANVKMLERKSTKNGKGTPCEKAFDLQILQVGEYDLVQYRIYGSYTEQCSLRVEFICSNLRRVQDHHESRKVVVE